jgi:hypothetical protein
VAVAYDDVVDVNLKVWGDEWEQRLGAADGASARPADICRAWGHPVWVRGDVTLDGRGAVLRALDVPAGQFVELRALVPRLRARRAAARDVRRATALDRSSAEERDDAAATSATASGSTTRSQPRRTTVTARAARASCRALAIVGVVWWLLGRDRRTTYDREYEQEPPDDTEPALVPGCSPRAAPPARSSSRPRSST